MSTDLLNLLKQLSTAVGISGYEQNVTSLVQEQFADYVDEFVSDALSNLIMIKRGAQKTEGEARRKIMLAAHTDEIGGMVTHIDRGFLNFTSVGGLDTRLLMGQEVTVLGRETLHGIIASRPPHFANDDRNQYPEISGYQIDLGLSAEEVAQKIRVGDLIAMRKTPAELMGKLVSGKAMDDRASVLSMYVCLEVLSRLNHHWDVYAVATSQEEVGLKGARTSSYRINPDVAIAIDVTFADAPGVADGHGISLDKGPVLTIGANIHPVMLQRLKDTAAELEMGTQTDTSPAATGTDAWAIQISRDGIPTGLISIPLRYMHSPIETVSLKDIERVGRLMAYFIAGLDEDFIDKLIPKDGLEE